MKKILIIDWLDKYGGAERVLSSLQNVFGFEKVYTLTDIMLPSDKEKIFGKNKIEIVESKLKILKNRFRILFFTFHYFIRKFRIEENTDLIISSSHAVAKGLRKTSKNQLHISYFQARNFKYIWDDYELYFGKIGFIFYPMISFLRKVDIRHSKNPDYIVANSFFVKNWVKKNYNRESVVIYPPVDLDNFSLYLEKKDYYVAVGRLVAYKRFDIVVKAFNMSNKKLYVIGDGNQMKNLKKIAKSNIVFTGFLDSEQINDYVKSSKAFVHCGVEDFGIAPIEAQACGTPVIAYGKGGVLETVIDGITGVHFKSQTPESLLKAIQNFENKTFNHKKIREHALTFSKDRFENEIKEFVTEKYLEFIKKTG